MPAPTAGRLCVKLHYAVVGDIAGSPAPEKQLYSVAEVEEYGRLRSRPSPFSQHPSWEQDLTLEIGPQATKLKLCLYTDAPAQGEKLLGQGFFSLQQLFEDDDPGALEHVHIPLVNDIGKSQGQLVCSFRYFHSRTPGKFRDLLGRERIDEQVLGAGPKEGPKKVNAMSPVASPRAQSRAESPVLATPAAPHSRLVNAAS